MEPSGLADPAEATRRFGSQKCSSEHLKAIAARDHCTKQHADDGTNTHQNRHPDECYEHSRPIKERKSEQTDVSVLRRSGNQ